MFLNKYKIKWFIMFLVGVISLLISANSFSRCQVDEKFPLRTVYLMVDCIDMDEFIKKVDQNEVIVVDARTATEYQTIKIRNAVNLSYEDQKIFLEKLKKLHNDDPRPIVFYCNGHRCNLSYKAATLAVNSGIKDVYVFDEGVFEYTKKRPDNVLLLNKSISKTNTLIPSEKFKQHLLSADEFNKKILEKMKEGEKFKILDIRTRSNRLGLSAFAGVPNERYIPINKIKKLNRYLNKTSENNEDLFVYDWSGKQLRWVQYYINDHQIKNYYFLKGGALGKINNELKGMGFPEMVN